MEREYEDLIKKYNSNFFREFQAETPVWWHPSSIGSCLTKSAYHYLSGEKGKVGAVMLAGTGFHEQILLPGFFKEYSILNPVEQISAQLDFLSFDYKTIVELKSSQSRIGYKANWDIQIQLYLYATRMKANTNPKAVLIVEQLYPKAAEIIGNFPDHWRLIYHSGYEENGKRDGSKLYAKAEEGERLFWVVEVRQDQRVFQIAKKRQQVLRELCNNPTKEIVAKAQLLDSIHDIQFCECEKYAPMLLEMVENERTK